MRRGQKEKSLFRYEAAKLAALITSAAFSAIAWTVANGATEKVDGMTLASTTRRLAVRWSLKSAVTTPRKYSGSSAAVLPMDGKSTARMAALTRYISHEEDGGEGKDGA